MQNLTASVTKSVTRKVNLGNYESVDIFESRSHHWHDKIPTSKEMDDLAEALYKECLASVERQIEDYLSEGEVDAPFKK